VLVTKVWLTAPPNAYSVSTVMAETLIVWFTRFTDDPKKVASRLKGRPVLLFEPPLFEESKDDQDEDFRFHTSSGEAAISPRTGEAVVAVVEKTKDNAFQRRVTIGRTSNNDIVLDDISVSRFHAWLEPDARGHWVLADAQSRNGTTVDGLRVEPKAAVAVRDGTIVRVGHVALKFYSASGFLAYLNKRAKGS
jgi:hypothetical protein